MLYELYIDGKKADLKKDVEICFNYTNVDTDKPEAQHGGYSKSVDLPGTEVNNNIFGQIYNLDRRIVFDNEKGSEIGAFFDPRKRTDYVLWFNGDIVDKGYLSLDSIKRENGDLTYSITLFSELGDFFYNLMYNKDTGEELNLGNLHYGFIDEDDNPIDEDNEPLMEWNKDYIYESWYRLNTPIEDGDKSLYSCITAAPTYSGYYDDFDSSKVLVNYDSLPPKSGDVQANWPVSQQILNPAMTADTSYTAYKGWVLAEATRDLDEHEVRDMRSQYQRPAIKMSTIFDAISNPENNGGYTVVWDEEIKNSPYFKNTYLILNKVDFDLDKNYAEEIHLNATLNGIAAREHSGFYTTDFFDGSGNTVFNLSNANAPQLKVSHNMVLHTNVAFDENRDELCTSYLYHSGSYGASAYVYGGQCVRAIAVKNGNIVAKSNTYIQTTRTVNIPEGFGYKVPYWREGFKNMLGLDDENDIIVIENVLDKTGEGTFKWRNNLVVELDLPAEDGIEIKWQTVWAWQQWNTASSMVYHPFIAVYRKYGKVNMPDAYYASDEVFLNTDTDDTGIFDDVDNEAGLKTKLYKNILFAETSSPYKYLVGFTRMIGAKYRYDLAEKKIYINKRENYYLPIGYKIDKWIDRKQGIEINPTSIEYKWYEYGFETPETYASQLYKRKNVWEYGLLKVDTGFYFNNESHNIFDDIPYQNAIPYLQNSLYYAMYDGVPAILNSPTMDVSTFKTSGTSIVDKSTKIWGYCGIHDVVKMDDNSGDKLCMFDDKNGEVDDIKNCLAFFNGMKTTADWYQISDNIPLMQDLNGENKCFMYVSANTEVYTSKNSVTKSFACRWTKKIPVFSKYLSGENGAYTDSLDFVQPNYTFIGNDSNYQGGICIYGRFWKPFIEDIYDPDGNAVTAYMFLREKPDEAMRKFYLFDNSIWVISEITDYNVSSSAPTKIKFVKVYNTDNYTNKEIIWNNKYDKIV